MATIDEKQLVLGEERLPVRNQYLHPDYVQPSSTPDDASVPKASPLALLAQTCNNIGRETKPKPYALSKPQQSPVRSIKDDILSARDFTHHPLLNPSSLPTSPHAAAPALYSNTSPTGVHESATIPNLLPLLQSQIALNSLPSLSGLGPLAGLNMTSSLPNHISPVAAQNSNLEALALQAQIAQLASLDSSMLAKYCAALQKGVTPYICTDSRCTQCPSNNPIVPTSQQSGCAKCSCSSKPTSPATSIPEFTCNWMEEDRVCGKKFSSNELLLEHVQVHTKPARKSISPPVVPDNSSPPDLSPSPTSLSNSILPPTTATTAPQLLPKVSVPQSPVVNCDNLNGALQQLAAIANSVNQVATSPSAASRFDSFRSSVSNSHPRFHPYVASRPSMPATSPRHAHPSAAAANFSLLGLAGLNSPALNPYLLLKEKLNGSFI